MEKIEKTERSGVSRRELLGKSAKYAAMVPVASLVVTKANAHDYVGSNLNDCIEAFVNAGGTNAGGAASGHCLSGSHPDVPDPV